VEPSRLPLRIQLDSRLKFINFFVLRVSRSDCRISSGIIHDENDKNRGTALVLCVFCDCVILNPSNNNNFTVEKKHSTSNVFQ
jgi:hypothetical protein